MCSKSNLPNRVKKAKSAVPFIGRVGKNGNATYLVPGSNGKQYQVKVRRNKVLSVQCWLRASGSDCPGNSNGTICYHSMAVCELLAEQAGKSISWTANKDDAKRLERLGGKTFRVISHQSGSEMWGVAK